MSKHDTDKTLGENEQSNGNSPKRAYRHFPITWVLTRLNRKKLAMVAFCGKTGHAIKITSDESLLPLTVLDLIVSKDRGCEEGKRCFYFACPLNRTSPETYYKDQGQKHKGLFSPKPGEEMNATELGFEIKAGTILTLKDKRGRVKPYIELRKANGA